MFYKFRIVERFLLDDYEERQLSTFALTMYRYDAKIEGKNYKVSPFFYHVKGKKLAYHHDKIIFIISSKSVYC